MKIGRIIHQQVIQLKWHFLTCLGLLMALPIEEAFINLKDGDGFYATGLSLSIPVMAVPLLAGLIACGNVQADLDDKRYIFWRSKPVGVKTFIALKYFVGLLMAFVVIASPVVFSFITCCVIQGEKIERGFVAFIVNFQLISLLTYSLCFFCNTLVRKTARAWLIGMAITVFLLLVPFILPFRFKDISGDFLLIASTVYIYITIGVSLIAFILSLFAVSRNWHLQTNLKGLLWTSATLIFLLMLLFTRQVANIKVLDEVELSKDYALIGSFQELYDCSQEGHLIDIETSGDKIGFKDVFIKPSEEARRKLEADKPLYSVGQTDLELIMYPYYDVDRINHKIGNDTYSFKLDGYIHREKIRKNAYYESLKKVYLCSYQLLEGVYPLGVSVLDLSDCIVENGLDKISLRKYNDKLIVFIQDSFIVVQIKEDGNLEIIGKHIYGLKGYSSYRRDRDRTYKIPLIPIQDISIEERVKLSVDINYRYYCRYSPWRDRGRFSRYSLVDVNDNRISFCLFDEGELARFDVVRWDEDYVYCKFRDSRQFTFLEMLYSNQGYFYKTFFIKDGKFYYYERLKLLVFDIRSDRIRKLGHFQHLRHDFDINDLEVLGDGNILIYVNTGLREFNDGSRATIQALSLLKNPE